MQIVVFVVFQIHAPWIERHQEEGAREKERGGGAQTAEAADRSGGRANSGRGQVGKALTAGGSVQPGEQGRAAGGDSQSQACFSSLIVFQLDASTYCTALLQSV